MNRKKLGWKPIVLYVCAVLLMIYAIYMMFSIGTYIGQMVEASYISGFMQIAGTFLGYFAQSVSMYIVYALLLAAAGYIIDVLERGLPQKSQPEEEQEIRKAAIASNVYFEMIKNHVIQEIVKKYNIGPEEEQKIREAANVSNDWLKMMNELVKQKKALAQSEG